MMLYGNSASLGFAKGYIINIEANDNNCRVPSILVTKYFTPDIIIKYKNIQGIISENGGATSHAAIIARTMGIPCITGVKNATTLLKSGQMAFLEAKESMGKGYVEVLADND